MSRTAIKKVFHGIGAVLGVLVFGYMIAFFLVAACVLDSTRPVADCRQNMAGEMIARSLSIFIK